jgi:hypothetical protein
MDNRMLFLGPKGGFGDEKPDVEYAQWYFMAGLVDVFGISVDSNSEMSTGYQVGYSARMAVLEAIF